LVQKKASKPAVLKGFKDGRRRSDLSQEKSIEKLLPGTGHEELTYGFRRISQGK